MHGIPCRPTLTVMADLILRPATAFTARSLSSFNTQLQYRPGRRQTRYSTTTILAFLVVDRPSTSLICQSERIVDLRFEPSGAAVLAAPFFARELRFDHNSDTTKHPMVT